MECPKEIANTWNDNFILFTSMSTLMLLKTRTLSPSSHHCQIRITVHYYWFPLSVKS